MIFSSLAHIGEMSLKFIQINQFGDGFCAASFSDIADGMNRNIGIRTLSDGGGLIGPDSKECNTRSPGTHDVFVVPPVFSVHAESSEVQRIFVLDDDNTNHLEFRSAIVQTIIWRTTHCMH